ncbi:MAG TPA: hypothetical protein VHW26_01665 [Solirubrobacteraceae bacterium]|nr:hypothetical protein [Solirubrobacteraceae bacterium]
MDLSKLGRDEWLVGGGGILLIIDLLLFPWHHESLLGISASQSATSAPDAIWGVIALLLTVAVVVDFGLSLFSPLTQVPTTQLGRAMTRCALAAAVIFFLLLKLFAHTQFLGFGCYLGFILAIAVVVGAYRYAQEAEVL